LCVWDEFAFYFFKEINDIFFLKNICSRQAKILATTVAAEKSKQWLFCQKNSISKSFQPKNTSLTPANQFINLKYPKKGKKFKIKLV
jgi:hypothetical protein